MQPINLKLIFFKVLGQSPIFPLVRKDENQSEIAKKNI